MGIAVFGITYALITRLWPLSDIYVFPADLLCDPTIMLFSFLIKLTPQ